MSLGISILTVDLLMVFGPFFLACLNSLGNWQSCTLLSGLSLAGYRTSSLWDRPRIVDIPCVDFGGRNECSYPSKCRRHLSRSLSSPVSLALRPALRVTSY